MDVIWIVMRFGWRFHDGAITTPRLCGFKEPRRGAGLRFDLSVPPQGGTTLPRVCARRAFGSPWTLPLDFGVHDMRGLSVVRRD